MRKLNDTQLETIEILLRLAINGTLSIEQLNIQFPQPDGESEDLRILFEDIENAVQHTPGSWLTKGVNSDVWRTQIEYATIVCDCLLLKKTNNLEEWQEVKIRILRTVSPLTYENIQKYLREQGLLS